MDSLQAYMTLMVKLREMAGMIPKGFAYSCVEDYVFSNGRPMVSEPLTKEQSAYIRSVIHRGRFPLKECFANSQRVLLSTQDDRLAYYEGYATTGLLPVHHGWLVLDGRCVIDLTWRQPDAKSHFVTKGPVMKTRILGEIPPRYAYYGVEAATRSEILKTIRETKMWISFLDDWHRDYPKLKAA